MLSLVCVRKLLAGSVSSSVAGESSSPVLSPPLRAGLRVLLLLLEMLWDGFTPDALAWARPV